jgi:hypothetical protein
MRRTPDGGNGGELANATSAAAADMPALRNQQHTRQQECGNQSKCVRELDNRSNNRLTRVVHYIGE